MIMSLLRLPELDPEAILDFLLMGESSSLPSRLNPLRAIPLVLGEGVSGEIQLELESPNSSLETDPLPQWARITPSDDCNIDAKHRMQEE